MELPIRLQNDIVNFLASLPNIHDSGGQRALVYSAGLDSRLQNQIPFGKPTTQFLLLFVSALIRYGRLNDGRNALEATLEAAKSYIGQDKQAYCDTLMLQVKDHITIAYPPGQRGQGGVGDEVVATVNNEEITQNEIDLLFTLLVFPAFQAEIPRHEIPAAQKKKIEQELIQKLVTERVILQLATQLNITADEALINQRFESFKIQYPNIPKELLRQFLAQDIIMQRTIQQEVISKIPVSDQQNANTEVMKWINELKGNANIVFL